jgi:hypothetical protein
VVALLSVTVSVVSGYATAATILPPARLLLVASPSVSQKK